MSGWEPPQVVIFRETEDHVPYGVVLYVSGKHYVIQRVTTGKWKNQTPCLSVEQGDPRHTEMGLNAEIARFYEGDIKIIHEDQIQRGAGKCPFRFWSKLVEQSATKLKRNQRKADTRAAAEPPTSDLGIKLAALVSKPPEPDE